MPNDNSKLTKLATQRVYSADRPTHPPSRLGLQTRHVALTCRAGPLASHQPTVLIYGLRYPKQGKWDLSTIQINSLAHRSTALQPLARPPPAHCAQHRLLVNSVRQVMINKLVMHNCLTKPHSVAYRFKSVTVSQTFRNKIDPYQNH